MGCTFRVLAVISLRMSISASWMSQHVTGLHGCLRVYSWHVQVRRGFYTPGHDRGSSSSLGPSFSTELLTRLTQPDRATRALAQSRTVECGPKSNLGSRFLIELARRSSIFNRASKQAHRFNTRRPRRILGQAASARSGSVLRQRPSCWCHRADLRDPCTLGRGSDEGCKVNLVV